MKYLQKSSLENFVKEYLKSRLFSKRYYSRKDLTAKQNSASFYGSFMTLFIIFHDIFCIFHDTFYFFHKDHIFVKKYEKRCKSVIKRCDRKISVLYLLEGKIQVA